MTTGTKVNPILYKSDGHSSSAAQHASYVPGQCTSFPLWACGEELGGHPAITYRPSSFGGRHCRVLVQTTDARFTLRQLTPALASLARTTPATMGSYSKVPFSESLKQRGVAWYVSHSGSQSRRASSSKCLVAWRHWWGGKGERDRPSRNHVSNQRIFPALHFLPSAEFAVSSARNLTSDEGVSYCQEGFGDQTPASAT